MHPPSEIKSTILLGSACLSERNCPRKTFKSIGEKRSFEKREKSHLRGRHLSVLNLKFDFISDGGCTREEEIALSLKRHLFPHGGREPKAFWICFSRVHPPSEIKSNFKFKTLKRHLLKRHLTLSDRCRRDVPNPDPGMSWTETLCT